ncbi:unnamed protein product [Owenia fusiformis]|uniref:Fucosyltransferase n=1 Tax=Owenia fusiformis TaxID=6347 RepID=A0A8S4NTZ0_OWEFU|nr:unnamed protein product [Owenia fusiformis]
MTNAYWETDGFGLNYLFLHCFNFKMAKVIKPGFLIILAFLWCVFILYKEQDSILQKPMRKTTILNITTETIKPSHKPVDNVVTIDTSHLEDPINSYQQDKKTTGHKPNDKNDAAEDEDPDTLDIPKPYLKNDTDDYIPVPEMISNTLTEVSPFPTSMDLISILFWTMHHSTPDREGTVMFSNCRHKNCRLTNDKTELKSAEYLMFHVSDIENTLKYEVMPPFHPPKQKWILYTREPPTRRYFKNVQLLKNDINITASYWSGSDIFLPYGWTKRYENITRDDTNYHGGKTKMIAWMVGHCKTPSNREGFVAQLNKYLPVDIMGKCGQTRCEDKEGETCLEWLGKTFLFYLAFENSDCEDYITEKVWRNAMMTNMIPLVRGKTTNFKRLLPPGSFIHVNDFKDIPQLKNFIISVHHCWL